MKTTDLIIGKHYRAGKAVLVYCGREKSDYMYGPSDYTFIEEDTGKAFHCTSVYVINNIENG